MSTHEPTIANILRRLAAEHDGPVPERRVLEQVLERRPSSAKNPYATIRERLRWDGLTLGWLRLNRHELVPLRVALQGLRFRCVPRAADVERGILPLAHLQPFVGLRSVIVHLCDNNGAQIAHLDLDADSMFQLPEHFNARSCNLSAWYAHTGFVPGDSILVTTIAAEPLTLQLVREPAAEFRRADVAAQDAELLSAIVERVARSQMTLMPSDEVVLPIFAAANWRTSYPGTPWQQLVTQDRRLQLIDDIFLTSQRHPALRLFSNDEVFTSVAIPERDQIAASAELLAEIDALQRDLRRAREDDADQGIWDGQLLRASAAYGVVEGLHHGFSDVDGFDSDLWSDDWDPEGPFEIDERLADDPVALNDARRRLLAALPPGVAEQLHDARPEEAELIIASHLNYLLVHEPKLFPRIDVPSEGAGDFAQDPDITFDDDEGWQDAWDADDDLVTDLDDAFWDDDDAVSTRSGELISQFSDYLAEMGKSAATARLRIRDLHIVADFLASFYGRTLAEADYATLDECLFYFYPRRVMSSSPRQARSICTAVKQFYRFLLDRGEISDDRFAAALWRRRDQAARVVELYDRISSESPNFELLITRLFKPYTD
jgi:hypothetical protein